MKMSRMSTLDYFGRIPLYLSARALGHTPPAPLSLALCVTRRCNAACLTCNIASRASDELSLEGWRGVFRGIGRAVPWFTITGGEPFLREDMSDLLDSLASVCAPVFVTVPTNGSLSGAALEAAAVCRAHPGTGFALNISLDGPREVHDRVRGREGAFDSAIETYGRVRAAKPPNLRLGFHTVISKFNAGSMRELAEAVNALKPDSHFFEIAQPRAELAMEGADIAPGAEELKRALAVARGQLELENSGVAGWRLVRFLRGEYYRAVESSFARGEMPVCHAGTASAYAAPDGTLTACPNRGEMGKLGEGGFGKVWASSAASEARRAVKREGCRCELANAAYTNMILSPKTVAGVFAHKNK